MKRNIHKRLRESWSYSEIKECERTIKNGIFKSEEERNKCLRFYMDNLGRNKRNALFIVLRCDFHLDEFPMRRSIARGKKDLNFMDFQMEPTVLPKWFIESKILNE